MYVYNVYVYLHNHIYMYVSMYTDTLHNTLSCSYRIRLKVNEKGIYENLALLVRWVDFDSRADKEKKGEEEREKSRVIEGIKRFQEALEEVVRLVYEVHVVPESGSGGGSGARTPPMSLQRRYVCTLRTCTFTCRCIHIHLMYTITLGVCVCFFVEFTM